MLLFIFDFGRSRGIHFFPHAPHGTTSLRPRHPQLLMHPRPPHDASYQRPTNFGEHLALRLSALVQPAPTPHDSSQLPHRASAQTLDRGSPTPSGTDLPRLPSYFGARASLKPGRYALVQAILRGRPRDLIHSCGGTMMRVCAWAWRAAPMQRGGVSQIRNHGAFHFEMSRGARSEGRVVSSEFALLRSVGRKSACFRSDRRSACSSSGTVPTVLPR